MIRALMVITMLFISISSIAQNEFPTTTNSKVKIDGGSIKMISPNTTGGWARGLSYYIRGEEKQAAAFGYFGTGNEMHNFYIAFGANPWRSGNGLYLKPTGNIGIGTTNPLDKMHVENGDIRITNDTRTGGDGKASIIFSEISNSISAHARITYHGDDMSGDENYLGFGLGDPVSKDYNQLVIKRSGNIGVGTSMPAYKLDVLGTIRARELKVDMQGADFVFEADYPLRPISELEDFVKANKHLPEIAPAKEMQENGVNQSEMNQKLLQKIEELTLHIIQLNKRLEKVESK